MTPSEREKNLADIRRDYPSRGMPGQMHRDMLFLLEELERVTSERDELRQEKLTLDWEGARIQVGHAVAEATKRIVEIVRIDMRERAAKVAEGDFPLPLPWAETRKEHGADLARAIAAAIRALPLEET